MAINDTSCSEIININTLSHYFCSMKKILYLLLLSLLTIKGFSQTFKIVGKGNSGETKCSGYIYQSDNGLFHKISIHLSDMLEHEYQILDKEQKDERTIKYTLLDSNMKYSDRYIIKYKCPYGKYVYFFEFPPLYPKQGRTVYKAVKEKTVINGFIITEEGNVIPQ